MTNHHEPQLQYDLVYLQQRLIATQRQIICRKNFEEFLKRLSNDSEIHLSFEQIKRFKLYYLQHLLYKLGIKSFFERLEKNDQVKPNYADKVIGNFQKLSKIFIKLSFNSNNNNNEPNNAKYIHSIQDFCQKVEHVEQQSESKPVAHKLIKNIISYSILPSIFSFYITNADTYQFFKHFQEQFDNSSGTQNLSYIIQLLKGVFIMPAFTNFLHEVFYPILSPYIHGQKFAFEESTRSEILNLIISKSKELNYLCPPFIRLLAQSYHNNKMFIEAINKSLFVPLIKHPELFIGCHMPPYRPDNSFIIRPQLANQDFALFQKSKQFSEILSFLLILKDSIDQAFIQDFLDTLYDSNFDLSNKFTNLPPSPYIYLIDIESSLFSSSPGNEFKYSELLAKNEFELVRIESLFDYSKNNSITNSDHTETYWSLLKQLMLNSSINNKQNRPVEFSTARTRKDQINMIIGNLFIDQSDQCSFMRGLFLHHQMEQKSKQDGFWESFPTTAEDLEFQLNILAGNGIDTESIDSVQKAIQEQEVILHLSEKSLNYMNLMYKKFIVSVQFYRAFLADLGNSDQSKTVSHFFPTPAILLKKADSFNRIFELICENILQKNFTNNFLPMQRIQLSTLLSSVYLNHNLKYYDFLVYMANLGEIDKILNKLIFNQSLEIFKIIRKLCPSLFTCKSFQILFQEYFKDDMSYLIAIFGNNVDPSLKVDLLIEVFNHAIKKFKKHFLKINSEKQIEQDYIFPFIDYLLTMSNPSNLFSNIIFMLQFQRDRYFSETLIKYFDHFLQNVIAKLKLKELLPYYLKDVDKSEVRSDYFEPRKYVSRMVKSSEVEVQSDKAQNILTFLCEKMALSEKTIKGNKEGARFIAIGPDFYTNLKIKFS